MSFGEEPDDVDMIIGGEVEPAAGAIAPSQSGTFVQVGSNRAWQRPIDPASCDTYRTNRVPLTAHWPRFLDVATDWQS